MARFGRILFDIVIELLSSVRVPSYLYLSKERSARFLSRRERFQRQHTRDAHSCTQAIVVRVACNLSLTLS
jgi:hypothetical protein